MCRALLLAAAAAPSRALKLLAVGDWGGSGGKANSVENSVAAAMARETGAEYVLALGDNFYPAGVTSTSDPQWQSTFSAPFAGTPPFLAVLGNHDYEGDPGAQLGGGGGGGRWSMPDRHYTKSFSLGGGKTATFFFVDTSPFCQDYYRVGGETKKQYENLKSQDYRTQMQWLDQALGASGAVWKVVVGHHPVHPDGAAGYAAGAGAPRGYSCSMEGTLGATMAKHGVRLYYSGHWHEQRYYQGRSMDVVVSGGGCCVGSGANESSPTDLEGELVPMDDYTWRKVAPGYLSIDVTATKITSRYMGTAGDVQYTVTTTNGAPAPPAPPAPATKYKCNGDVCVAAATGLGPAACRSACGAPAPPPSPPSPPTPPSPPSPACADTPPDSSATCAEQKGYGKCSRSWMVGYCCRTCFACAAGCGK